MRIELPKRGVNLNFTLSNGCNGACLIFLFKKDLSLIDKRLYFSSDINFFFSNIFNKYDTLFNLAANRVKYVDTVLKKIVESNNMNKTPEKSFKPVSTRPGVMYGLYKAHRTSVDNCPLFWPILLALNTPSYKLAQFFTPILKTKGSFHFAEKLLIKKLNYLMVVGIYIPCLLTYSERRPLKFAQMN